MDTYNDKNKYSQINICKNGHSGAKCANNCLLFTRCRLKFPQVFGQICSRRTDMQIASNYPTLTKIINFESFVTKFSLPNQQERTAGSSSTRGVNIISEQCSVFSYSKLLNCMFRYEWWNADCWNSTVC